MGKEGAGFHLARQVAKCEKPVSPSKCNLAPVGDEDLVGLEKRVADAEAKLMETELELEEAVVPKVHSRKFTPSADEYNKHCATHLPYRNWCPICVQAKKKNTAHRRSTDVGRHKDISVLSMDYMFLNEIEDEANLPILVIHDSMSGGISAAQRKLS